MEFLLVTFIVVAFLLPGCWFTYMAITGNKGLRRSTAVMSIALRVFLGVFGCAGLTLSVLGIYVLTAPEVDGYYSTYPSSSSSHSTSSNASSPSTYPSSASSLSHSTREKVFYDIIATQDQNPYSNEWNAEVLQAAADYYDVPMSEINDIIMEGATDGWLQPDPP